MCITSAYGVAAMASSMPLWAQVASFVGVRRIRRTPHAARPHNESLCRCQPPRTRFCASRRCGGTSSLSTSTGSVTSSTSTPVRARASASAPRHPLQQAHAALVALFARSGRYGESAGARIAAAKGTSWGAR